MCDGLDVVCRQIRDEAEKKLATERARNKDLEAKVEKLKEMLVEEITLDRAEHCVTVNEKDIRAQIEKELENTAPEGGGEEKPKRCGNCDYWHNNEHGIGYCWENDMEIHIDDLCDDHYQGPLPRPHDPPKEDPEGGE